jgi:hypothetical protein
MLQEHLHEVGAMSLLEMIQGRLSPDAVQQIGQRIGASPTQTNQAISAALPLLMAAMARNAADPARAQGLARAVEEDHDGGLLDDLSGFLGAPQGRAADGNGILKHVLGNRRGAVEQQLGQGTGLGAAQMAQLLPLLAPLVMAALGKAKRQGGLDAGGLAGVLGGGASGSGRGRIRDGRHRRDAGRSLQEAVMRRSGGVRRGG